MPYHTKLVLKFECPFYCLSMGLKATGLLANSIDPGQMAFPDQMPHSAPSDLGLH